MVQFNLLPDVKLQYIRATYRKRVIMAVSVITSVVFLAIFVLLFLFVRVNQPRHITNLDKDVNRQVGVLKSKQDLDKVLTIQNQLNSLPALHEQKVYSSRLFEYLILLTPNEVGINGVELDLEAHTLNIKGDANDISTINKFVDTLKFTDYKVGEDDSKKGKAFSKIVLEGFSLSTGSGQTGASFEIKLEYDPVIFASTAQQGNAVANDVKLTIPKIITTRSETQKPANLFQDAPASAENQEGNQ